MVNILSEGGSAEMKATMVVNVPPSMSAALKLYCGYLYTRLV